MKGQAKSLSTPLSPNRTSFYPLCKRAFDIVFSLSALLGLSPFFLFIALGVKLSSKGPIFYRSERIGMFGIPFGCFKFRSMFPDADEKLAEILKDPLARKEWETFGKLKKDPRITRTGAFLRKTSLDELPQFLNALLGDISVVGPRPYLRAEIEKMGAKSQKILSIKPGITGLWQTSGRSNVSFEMRTKLDLIYAEKRSLLYDIYLILKTIPLVLFSRGAY